MTGNIINVWNFLSVLVRESMYRLKLCPSNWSVMWGTVTHTLTY